MMNIIDLSIKDPKNPSPDFERIADRLMNQLVISAGDQRYRITEIEFYFKSKDHPDLIDLPGRGYSQGKDEGCAGHPCRS